MCYLYQQKTKHIMNASKHICRVRHVQLHFQPAMPILQMGRARHAQIVPCIFPDHPCMFIYAGNTR